MPTKIDTMKKFELFETKDYSSFNFLDDNREIEPRRKLKESIRESGLICPIITTSDGFIIDGQHRFVALRELGLPVHYCINHTISGEAVLAANTNQKGWGLKDYVYRFARKGNIAYTKLEEILSEYDEFSPASVAQVCGVKFSGYTAEIKRGTYDMTADSRSFGELVLDNCVELHGYVRSHNSIKLVRAMYAIMKENPHFDIEVLKRKATMNKIHLYQKETDTADSIREVYNYHTSQSDRLVEQN